MTDVSSTRVGILDANRRRCCCDIPLLHALFKSIGSKEINFCVVIGLHASAHPANINAKIKTMIVIQAVYSPNSPPGFQDRRLSPLGRSAFEIKQLGQKAPNTGNSIYQTEYGVCPAPR
jgi:hypothetical protein